MLQNHDKTSTNLTSYSFLNISSTALDKTLYYCYHMLVVTYSASNIARNLMSIKHAILGFLSWQPSTGYELKKLFAESDTLSWSGNNNQRWKCSRKPINRRAKFIL
jgi:hypothetical protein